jgi:hypothetical protein
MGAVLGGWDGRDAFCFSNKSLAKWLVHSEKPLAYGSSFGET